MEETGSDQFSGDERRWSALMRAAQDGCEGSYRTLLAELNVVVERFLWRQLGKAELVDDCVQESLLAIHQARHTYDPQRPFRAWMFAIVRYKAADVLRQQSRLSEQQAALTQAASADDGSVSSSPEHGLSSGRLVDSLASPYREAVTLTKIQGYTAAEAATALNISESALKVRVHRGVQRLRKMFEGESF